MFFALLMACNPKLDLCDCPAGVPGSAVMLEGQCSCLPHLEATPNPEAAALIELSDGEEPDWDAIDAALADGDVVLRFDPAGSWERLYVRRTDEGPNRLVLDGGTAGARAKVRGILTPFDEGPRHRVTVRGFEITKSPDKGIFWEAGDDVLIEDVVIHDNKGSPALNLNYSSRSGWPSSNFTVRNSHIYRNNGECVYIGGSEGEDRPSHVGLLLENNLIHDCFALVDTKNDAINVKDRLVDVVVRRNVVLRSDWGLEVASQGLYESNLVIDTDREGVQVSDFFQPYGDMVFRDNAVLGAGEDGFHFSTKKAVASGLLLERNTVIGAGKAGLLVASDAGMELAVDQFVVVDSDRAFDGWGEADLTVGACRTSVADVDFARLFEGLGSCESAASVDVSAPAGPDGLFFTADDPWLVEGGAQLR